MMTLSDTDAAVSVLAFAMAVGTWGICVLAISLKRIVGAYLWRIWSEALDGIAEAVR
jgi:hypothetical protein